MEPRPLRGLTYRRGTAAVADWLLSALGASPADDARADLVPLLINPVADKEFGAGLPSGTLGYCTGVALALGALAGRATSGVAVAAHLRLPEVMAAAYGSSFEMRPGPPTPAPGGGWVHADLGAGEDHATFEHLRASLPPDVTARDLAEAAQSWRLPVCEYRPWSPSKPRLPLSFEEGPPAETGDPVDPVRVLDLTGMWAGPLATCLLKELGARVVKVEPSFRPDGFRALAGGGIYPEGRPCQPGRDSAMWNALNHGKQVVDLDLRADSDRRRFLALAESSDVVIDSFSPRVMPNFGLDLPTGPLYVSVPAFGPGPWRDWVAYGTGVHACSGLGDTGRHGYAPPAVSYPDPVAGFTAALGVTAALVGRRRGIGVSRVECPLAASVQPLVKDAVKHPDALLGDPNGLGRRLLEQARGAGRLADRTVCGRRLSHPSGVFPPVSR